MLFVSDAIATNVNVYFNTSTIVHYQSQHWSLEGYSRVSEYNTPFSELSVLASFQNINHAESMVATNSG